MVSHELIQSTHIICLVFAALTTYSNQSRLYCNSNCKIYPNCIAINDKKKNKNLKCKHTQCKNYSSFIKKYKSNK